MTPEIVGEKTAAWRHYFGVPNTAAESPSRQAPVS
jgi:hypothetical protein